MLLVNGQLTAAIPTTLEYQGSRVWGQVDSIHISDILRHEGRREDAAQKDCGLAQEALDALGVADQGTQFHAAPATRVGVHGQGSPLGRG
jgi:hypothetical protein